MNIYDAIRLLSRNLAPGRPRNLCSIPSRFKVLFVYSTASRSTLGPLTLICNARRCVKLIRHLSSPQVQNAWSCTTIPAYVFIQHRYNLTPCVCLIRVCLSIAGGRGPLTTYQTHGPCNSGCCYLIPLQAQLTSLPVSQTVMSGRLGLGTSCSGLEPTQM